MEDPGIDRYIVAIKSFGTIAEPPRSKNINVSGDQKSGDDPNV
jgi:hypothetical protein